MAKNKNNSSKTINKSSIEIDREKGAFIHIKDFGWFKKDDIMNNNSSHENSNINSIEIDGEKGDYFHMKGLGWLKKDDILDLLENPNEKSKGRKR